MKKIMLKKNIENFFFYKKKLLFLIKKNKCCFSENTRFLKLTMLGLFFKFLIMDTIIHLLELQVGIRYNDLTDIMFFQVA